MLPHCPIFPACVQIPFSQQDKVGEENEVAQTFTGKIAVTAQLHECVFGWPPDSKVLAMPTLT